ncbi:MAG: glycosyltransferase [Bacteroidetes bacterium]|nr:glycosyltransferase [Bacteroidota bacterium]
MKPRITVLMPVFNAADYLREAIESILGQTYCDFEFLIINDGSEDRSEEIILSYKDKRIRYFRNEKNAGIAATLNRGIELAATEYIARMDADDIAHPERLHWQVDTMDNHPELGVVGGYMQIIGNKKEIWKVPLSHREILASFPFQNPFFHPTVMIRKDVLIRNKLYYNPSCLHMEDYELWYRMRNLTRFMNLNKIILLFRYAGQNITVRKKDEKEKKINSFIREILTGMNIPCSNREEELHFEFANKILRKPIRQTLDRYKEWYLALLNANRQKGGFPEPEFSGKLMQLWLNTFYLLLDEKYGPEIIEYFFSLCRQLQVPWRHLCVMEYRHLKHRLF